jgi:16S rRNA (cytosine1402-N4)-methyltransferase
MLFDLGVSSPQLDDSERGFSYMRDAPLDMRMDKRDEISAFEAVNNWTEDKLRRVFYEYGEERYAGMIAKAIARKRVEIPINTTYELNAVIISAIPAAARREAQHPSKRCYQALRIAINDELGSVSRMLDIAPDMLKTGGRLCIISFHSLEDRLVKNAFAAHSRDCICPKDFPVCVCGVTPKLKLITKKPIVPDDSESKINPRARSAKLRIAERI